MAPPRGSASLQKKPGTIAISADGQSVSWTAVGSPKPELNLTIPSITNLQQTGATGTKVMLRIFEQLPGKEPKPHTFVFASDDQGRAEAGSIRDALSKAIAAFKAGPPQPAAQPDGSSAAMAIAAAVSAGGVGSSLRFDDEHLLEDVQLQQDLLASNKQLRATFDQAMAARPDKIKISAFGRQFWTSRIRALRAFAVEQKQRKGQYNVLATVKPRMEGEELKLSVTPEQVTLILTQYPIVSKAQSELSSKLDQNQFWTRFFQSRLFKKLKGEKITDVDRRDDLLDPYIAQPAEDIERQQRLLAAHVPHTIDLEGNEQDNSQRQGNAPDYLNRPSGGDRVPIMRTLNALSEKLLSYVTPNDVDPSEPIGMDEATYEEMALRDLAGDAEASRLILHIKDKARFFATGKGGDSQATRLYMKQDPAAVLRTLQTNLQSSSKQNLAEAIGVDDSDSDVDMDDGEAKDTHVGSRLSRRQATQQIFNAIREQKANTNDLALSDESDIAASVGLSPDTYRNLTLVQAAANVYLNHFWSAFHSGDPGRAEELAGVVEALMQGLENVKRTSEAAEQERTRKIDETRRLIRAHYEKTRQKQAFDPSSVGGGRKVVEQLMASTVRAIVFAQAEYQQALQEARKEERAQE